MNRRSICTCWLVMMSLAASSGCQTVSWPAFWPFHERERTTYSVPRMRIDAVKQFATRATGVDSPEQREITDQLARQVQIEPDPLVREAVIQTIAEFRTPIAQQVLEAGLSDEHRAVRLASCRALGGRGEAVSVPALARALRDDGDFDVRLAAAEALGHIKSPDAIQALAIALDDRNPAMQYVGVQSMKSITGKDYGGDVNAWRQVAVGESPPEPPPPSLADRLRRATPF